MSYEHDGGPAFPAVREMLSDGMTLRDWFAGQALVGLLSDTIQNLEEVAESAYGLADAMLAQRQKKDKVTP